jgi:L-fucose isomerase-like protein
VRIGVVCLARKTFDFVAAEEIYTKIKSDLTKIENIEWQIIPDLLIEVEETQNVAHYLCSTEIDALVCISGTFALGHLVLELNKVINKPILLWALEELPYDGGKIRLNSICGVNLNASNLYKVGIKNYYVIVGNEIDENWLDAIRVSKALSNAHVGILGYRAKGFLNLGVDEPDLCKELGVLLEHYELSEIFNFEIKELDVKEREKQIKNLFDTSKISESQLEKVAQLVVKFDNFFIQNNLDALAIRCWPEFAEEFGIAPCAAMSILQSESKILTCEGDIMGALSMLAHKAIGGETPFLADFSQINFEGEYGLLWHCGVAPCNLWDGKCNMSLDSYFAKGKGVTADFVMKPGEISLLRIDNAPGEYRIFLQKAMGVSMNKIIKGTYVKVKFDANITNVFNKIIYNGIAHHFSVTYGDFIKPLEIFAKIKVWRVIK